MMSLQPLRRVARPALIAVAVAAYAVFGVMVMLLVFSLAV